MSNIHDTQWMQYADCTGMPIDIFVPAVHENAKINYAKKICETCPVIYDCRAYSLRLARTYDLHGVYGGWSQKQRNNHLRTNALTVRRPGVAYKQETPR